MTFPLHRRSPYPEEDLQCPVCCDIYRDPVLLSCSHSFCRSCLLQYWDHREHQDCPVCRKKASGTGPLRNLALRNLCEALVRDRERRAAADTVAPGGHCSAHGEKLSLYCLEDGQAMCVSCQVSGGHKQHPCCPLGEATQQLKGFHDYVTPTEPEERIEQPGEAGSRKCDWRYFWMLLVGILFMTPLVFYTRSERSNSEQVSELRLLLIGPTGQGRSSSGNTILGREAFRVDFSLGAVTTECQRGSGMVAVSRPTGWTHRRADYHLTVVDTPGLSGGTAECAGLAAPGPHAILLVVKLGATFTEEDGSAVAVWLRENFGETSLKYTVVLFTGGDLLQGKPVQDLLKDSGPLLQLIRACGGRHHVLDNKRDDRTQVTELLAKIEEMVTSNGGKHLTAVKPRPASEPAGSGAVFTTGVLLVVGVVFKVIVDDLWSQRPHGGNLE